MLLPFFAFFILILLNKKLNSINDLLTINIKNPVEINFQISEIIRKNYINFNQSEIPKYLKIPFNFNEIEKVSGYKI